MRKRDNGRRTDQRQMRRRRVLYEMKVLHARWPTLNNVPVMIPRGIRPVPHTQSLRCRGGDGTRTDVWERARVGEGEGRAGVWERRPGQRRGPGMDIQGGSQHQTFQARAGQGGPEAGGGGRSRAAERPRGRVRVGVRRGRAGVVGRRRRQWPLRKERLRGSSNSRSSRQKRAVKVRLAWRQRGPSGSGRVGPTRLWLGFCPTEANPRLVFFFFFLFTLRVCAISDNTVSIKPGPWPSVARLTDRAEPWSRE
ncbi:hypothetical protein B0I35DRAFT_98536 [Stachybotrys elegans]|uniref:Uncharacterized protein n=1 Tax=Stachybotrys elegans TaxID=80388 RepID=A0A8K0SL61_9HYPO|nr:hypothetical protein B0I35DRAFT_98536 [Stachybotrys elegans]